MFTGADGDVPGQTGTDRHRWLRMRTSLREQRDRSVVVAARLPLYGDLAATYRVPGDAAGWFTPPVAAGRVDPAWADAAAALTHLRALDHRRRPRLGHRLRRAAARRALTRL